jgi:hypothetical protein
LVKFSVVVEFQKNVLPYVNPVSIFMDQFDSIAVIVEMNTIWIGVVVSNIMVVIPDNETMGNDEIQVSF